jgi:DNA-binding transcriptional LysR family regulator
MQSRRIVDAVLRRVGIEPKPLMETDSVNAVIAHVRAGHWASIMPNSALETVEMTDKLRAIPLVEPDVFHTIGLVVSERYPIQPGVASLIDEARTRAPGGLLPAA